MQMRISRPWMVMSVLLLLLLAFVPFSQTALGVEFDYTLRTVTLGGAILGAVAGALGSFAVLRRQSLLGDSLSHAALPGVGVAFLVAGRDLGALLLGAGIAAWLGILMIEAITQTTRIKQDAAMGIVLTSWFALGIVLLTYIQGQPDAGQAGLEEFIFGQAAAIVERDVQLVALAGLVCLGVLVLFWKEIKLLTFDLEFSSANGYPVRFLQTLLSTMIVVAIVLGLQLAGVILMVGLLIAPGVAARQWVTRLGEMIALAGVMGAFSGATGAIISAVDVRTPTGPMIIVVASVLVALSILFAPERGVLWQVLKTRADRQRFAQRAAAPHGTTPDWQAEEGA